jgi:hypothetical protein
MDSGEMSGMRTLNESQIIEFRDRLSGWIDRLRSAKTRTRLSFFFALNVVVVLAVLPFLGVVTDQTARASVRPKEDFDGWPTVQAPAIDDKAIYLHSKLMRIDTARTGAPVLRFVACRHYAKEHKKVVQTGISSDGHATLRFMSGDYCLFGSDAAVPMTDGRDVLDAEFRRLNQLQIAVSEEPANQSDPMKELLTPYQRYTCEKFGPACFVALAIQYAENPQGACEVYHYNSSNGTLDWGYFQINTVHLMKPGLNLRDLLDCKANIDYAYELYRQSGFKPWSTYVSGNYRKFLGRHQVQVSAYMASLHGSVPFNVLQLK